MDFEAIAASLESTPELLTILLRNVDDRVVSWHMEPGYWCIKEVIGHLLAVDGPAFADRISLIINEVTPDLPPWSVQTEVHFCDDCSRSVVDMLAELASTRVRHAAFVRTLADKPFYRVGMLPNRGPLKASDFLNECFYHDLEHLQQIMEILKADFWPGFSDNMKEALRS